MLRSLAAPLVHGRERLELQDQLLEKPTHVRLKFLGTGVPGGKPAPPQHSVRDVQVRSLEDIATQVEEWLGSPGSWQLSTAANWPLTADAMRRPTSRGCPLVVNIRDSAENLLERLDKLTKHHRELEMCLREEVGERTKEDEKQQERIRGIEVSVEELGSLTALHNKMALRKGPPGRIEGCCRWFCKDIKSLCPTLQQIMVTLMLGVMFYWMMNIDAIDTMRFRLLGAEQKLHKLKHRITPILETDVPHKLENLSASVHDVSDRTDHLRQELGRLDKSMLAQFAELSDVYKGLKTRADEATQLKDSVSEVRTELGQTRTLALAANKTAEGAKAAAEGAKDVLKSEKETLDAFNKSVMQQVKTDGDALGLALNVTYAKLKTRLKVVEKQLNSVHQDVQKTVDAGERHEKDNLQTFNVSVTKQVQAADAGLEVPYEKLKTRIKVVEAQLGQVQEAIDKTVNASIASFKASITSKDEHALEAVRSSVKSEDKALSDGDAALSRQAKALQANGTRLKDRLAAVEAKLEEVEGGLKHKVSGNGTRLRDRLAAVEAKLKEVGDELHHKVSGNGTRLRDRLAAEGSQLKEVEGELKRKVSGNGTRLMDRLEAVEAEEKEVEGELKHKVSGNGTRLKGRLEAVEARLKEIGGELRKAGETEFRCVLCRSCGGSYPVALGNSTWNSTWNSTHGEACAGRGEAKLLLERRASGRRLGDASRGSVCCGRGLPLALQSAQGRATAPDVP